MTIGEVIARASARWPHAYGEAVMIPLVQQVDDQLRTEVLGLPPRTDPQAPLAAAAPYAGLYEHFLVAMLAQMDGEYSRYNAEMALFGSLWDSCARAHRRACLPDAGAEVHGYA